MMSRNVQHLTLGAYSTWPYKGTVATELPFLVKFSMAEDPCILELFPECRFARSRSMWQGSAQILGPLADMRYTILWYSKGITQQADTTVTAIPIYQFASAQKLQRWW